MTAATGFVHRVEWANARTSQPERMPRVLAEMFVPTMGREGSRTPTEIADYPRPSGYCVTSAWMAQPIRSQSPERLAVGRRKRLDARVAARSPMFAAEFVAAELARQPVYFAGGENRSGRDEVLAEEEARRAFLVPRANQLIVYWRE